MTTHIQNHFHLDLSTNIDGDGAPTARYKTRQRSIQPVVQTVVTTSWNGVRHRSTVVDETGEPVLFHDYKFRVVCSNEEYETISALLGKTVKLVDYYHPDDGEAHTSFVHDVAVVSIADIIGIGYLWYKVELTIELTGVT